jgi:hypothetical protein
VFRIFGQESGGSQLWSEVHNVTTNSIGVESVVLGSTAPLSIDFSGPLWLLVEAEGEVLLPGRELTSAPYAFHDEVGGAGDGYSLDAVDGSPVDAVYVNGEGWVDVAQVVTVQGVFSATAGLVRRVGGHVERGRAPPPRMSRPGLRGPGGSHCGGGLTVMLRP